MTDASTLLRRSVAYTDSVIRLRHPPRRPRFAFLARRWGVEEVDFEAWAKKRTWQ